LGAIIFLISVSDARFGCGKRSVTRMRKNECLSTLLRIVTIAVAIIALFSKPSLAGNKSTPIERSNLSLSTAYGPLIVNLSITPDSFQIPTLTGDVTNGTDRAWRMVSFKIVLLDKNGNELPTDITVGAVQAQELKKNGTSVLTDLVNRPFTFNGVPWKKVSNLRVQFDAEHSYYDSQYVFALVKPRVSQDLTYEDECSAPL
jgi:hypothetical protein